MVCSWFMTAWRDWLSFPLWMSPDGAFLPAVNSSKQVRSPFFLRLPQRVHPFYYSSGGAISLLPWMTETKKAMSLPIVPFSSAGCWSIWGKKPWRLWESHYGHHTLPTHGSPEPRIIQENSCLEVVNKSLMVIFLPSYWWYESFLSPG